MYGESLGIPVERRALYYPWVHFHSDEWVKKALLVFPGLFRMVSDRQAPYDSPLVDKLRAKSLIRHAELSTPNAQDAQLQLQSLMQEDLDTDPTRFRLTFGKEQARRSGRPSFQMHLAKTSANLEWFLRSNDLAWSPDNPEHADYSELHPDLGQAVMGTIAMACAEDAGLHIVGVESPRGKDVSSELNSTLVANDRAGPYKHFVRKQLRPAVLQPSADELFHFLVHFNCDVSELDADALVALQDEREPLREMKRRVQALASTIPAMKDSRSRHEAFQQGADEIVKAWKGDRLNLSRYAREALALDAFGGGAHQFLSVMQDKLIPLGAGSISATAFSATAGLTIGLLTHLGTSYTKLKKAEANSPLRYMTLAESRGVAFSISRSQ